MRLIVVHYHLRPGGIRRIIELAMPHLVRAIPGGVDEVVLATGEALDGPWNDGFARQVAPTPVRLFTEPAFGYLSGQRGSATAVTRRLRGALRRLLEGCTADNTVVWAHNPGVGRNLLLTRELVGACEQRGVTLLAHHHDWWFDNRWPRWPEMRRFGIRTLPSAARTVFPDAAVVRHLAINEADADVLRRHFGPRAAWLPNLTERGRPPAPGRVRAAARWLEAGLGERGAPVWILPCRLLRRKNVAEALLLTRWLRPEAWLVTTGGASSADEVPYARALEAAGRRHGWRLRLGMLAGGGAAAPSIPELLAASECVLLTSIQEGFGLPYLEAASAGRPLVARALPNIAPDLERFGFRFPQGYDEIWIPPDLFDAGAEARRQVERHGAWRRQLPRACRGLAGAPLLAGRNPGPVPFSRLTLTAQLEVLSQPAELSWARCTPLNRRLLEWRERAAQGRLQVSRWPARANRWLSGPAYARRWLEAAMSPGGTAPGLATAVAAQREFIAWKLGAVYRYPLLWSRAP